MKNALFGFILGIALSLGAVFLFMPKNVTTGQETAIQNASDSIGNVIAGELRIDTLRITRYKTKLVHDTLYVDSVRNLPSDKQVEYFEQQTESDCSMIADTSDVGVVDTSVICPMIAIRNANILIAKGKKAAENVDSLQVILDGRGKIIEDYAKQLVLKDELLTIKDDKIKEQTKAIRREKVIRVIAVAGAVLVEVATIVLLI